MATIMGSEGESAEGPQSQRRFGLCHGYPRGQSSIGRWLYFVGSAVAIEMLAWVLGLTGTMSPGGVAAIFDQLTWVNGPIIGALIITLPCIAGLAIASNPPAGKDSYCHMAVRGIWLGSGLGGAFGVKFLFY